MDRENIGRTVALCGVQGCCPTAEFTQEGVVLRPVGRLGLEPRTHGLKA